MSIDNGKKAKSGWVIYVDEQFPRLGFVTLYVGINIVRISVVGETTGDTELIFSPEQTKHIKKALEWAIYLLKKGINEPVKIVATVFSGKFQNENDGSGALIVQVLDKGVIQLVEAEIDDTNGWLYINIEMAEKIIARLDEAIAMIADEQKQI
jgi:hypothetical protein